MGIRFDDSRVRAALKKAPVEFERKIVHAFRTHGAEFEKAYVRRHFGARLSDGKNNTSDRMASRTGALRRSVRTDVQRKGNARGVTLQATIGNARTAAYVETQEKGAVIRGNPWLAIPLPANLTGAGRPRFTSPGSLLDDPSIQTFLQKSKKGNLIIFRAFDDGRDPVPLWVLKRSVKVPARLNFRKFFRGKKMHKDRIKRVNAAARGALKAAGFRG